MPLRSIQCCMARAFDQVGKWNEIAGFLAPAAIEKCSPKGRTSEGAVIPMRAGGGAMALSCWLYDERRRAM